MIIVTGATGFIGKRLMNTAPGPILGVDMMTCEGVFNVDWTSVKRVYHMGAISSTTETDIDKLYRYNIDYTLRLFQQCIKHSVPVSYASSASIYGNWSVAGYNPLNYYAMSKAWIDMWVETNKHLFSNIRGYRFFNVYGEGEDHKGNQASPVHTFIRQAKENGIINIFDENGDGERDFVYVGDVIDRMLSDVRPSGIYDLGTGRTYKFSQVAQIIAEKYDAKIRVIPFPNHLKGKYQHYTCSKIKEPSFKTIEDYVSEVFRNAT